MSIKLQGQTGTILQHQLKGWALLDLAPFWHLAERSARRRAQPRMSDISRRSLERRRALLLAGIQGEEKAACQINFHLKDNQNWAVIHDLRQVRIPVHFGQVFRSNSDTRSDSIRTVIPIQFGHLFRFNPNSEIEKEVAMRNLLRQ